MDFELLIKSNRCECKFRVLDQVSQVRAGPTWGTGPAESVQIKAAHVLTERSCHRPPDGFSSLGWKKEQKNI